MQEDAMGARPPVPLCPPKSSQLSSHLSSFKFFFTLWNVLELLLLLFLRKKTKSSCQDMGSLFGLGRTPTPLLKGPLTWGWSLSSDPSGCYQHLLVIKPSAGEEQHMDPCRGSGAAGSLAHRGLLPLDPATCRKWQVACPSSLAPEACSLKFHLTSFRLFNKGRLFQGDPEVSLFPSSPHRGLWCVAGLERTMGVLPGGLAGSPRPQQQLSTQTPPGGKCAVKILHSNHRNHS